MFERDVVHFREIVQRPKTMRSRLFLRWFNNYTGNDSFLIKTAVINDDGEDNYVAMIVQRNNSQIEEENVDKIIKYILIKNNSLI